MHDIPADGQVALAQWAAARNGATLPALDQFAPGRLPKALLPWSMTYRRDAARNLTYGVVGEELRFLFGNNPRGKAVLGYADPATREFRYGLIHRSLDEGTPFWYRGDVLFENMPRQDMGRLGLPTRTAAGEALLIIYFLYGAVPRPLPPLAARPGVDEAAVIWLERA